MERKKKLNTLKSKYLKLNAFKLGLAAGILCAIYIILISLFAEYFPMNIAFLQEIYGIFGYTPSGTGVLLGAIYGFIDTFIIGWLFAVIYNKLL